ncbi:MAG: hypothetical protein ACYTEX_24920, partial [Planctomycetota bacterium]
DGVSVGLGIVLFGRGEDAVEEALAMMFQHLLYPGAVYKVYTVGYDLHQSILGHHFVLIR